METLSTVVTWQTLLTGGDMIDMAMVGITSTVCHDLTLP